MKKLIEKSGSSNYSYTVLTILEIHHFRRNIFFQSTFELKTIIANMWRFKLYVSTLFDPITENTYDFNEMYLIGLEKTSKITVGFSKRL
jgi:hypothetical protein